MAMENLDIFFTETNLELSDRVQDSNLEDGNEDQELRKQEDIEQNCGIVIKIPNLGEFKIDDGEQEDQELQKQEKREDNCGIVISSSFTIKIPNLREFKKDDGDEEEDGLRTPTSLDQRIPLIPIIPPAPRKPKTLASRKRKTDHHRKILLDISDEIQSFFQQDFDGNYMIKKSKNECYFSK